jgi:hypothetical protein
MFFSSFIERLFLETQAKRRFAKSSEHGVVGATRFLMRRRWRIQCTSTIIVVWA